MIHYILVKLYYLIKKLFRKERWLIDKINFINNTTPALNATNLNKLQDNVEDEINEKQANIDLKLDKTSVKDVYSTSAVDTYSCNYVNSLETYSTTETRVGTWIDNKPIYRKVLNYTSPTFNNYVNHNIANIDNITNIICMVKQGNDTFRTLPIVYQESGSIQPRFCISLYSITTSQFLISAGSYYTENISSMNLIVIIEYTKTTD